MFDRIVCLDTLRRILKDTDVHTPADSCIFVNMGLHHRGRRMASCTFLDARILRHKVMRKERKALGRPYRIVSDCTVLDSAQSTMDKVCLHGRS